MSEIIRGYAVDLACIGIGENGHIAFNDPPADFLTEAPFIVVNLDEADRRQQLGEGWFSSLEDVPKKGITMSIQQVLRAKKIVCVVPDRRKAKAVFDCLMKEISRDCPASILRTHEDALLFLDRESASLLPQGQFLEST
jgi:glucosamine-6-phosphate deaminase